MSRGFVDSGRFVPIFAVESRYRRAAATYAANFPEADLDQSQIQRVEQFPERRRRHRRPAVPGILDARSAPALGSSRRLWREYYRRPGRETRPAVFVMENVPQILDSQEYEEFVAAIEKDGFYGSMNAC